MLKITFLTALFLNLLILFIPIRGTKVNGNRKVKKPSKTKEEKRVKISLIIEPKSTSKPPSRSSQSSFKKLAFSQSFHKENQYRYDPNYITKTDPGGVKRKCLSNLLYSAVEFPELVFQNQIARIASLRVFLNRNFIEIKMSPKSHPILSKILCFNLKEQIKKIKRGGCLKQKELRGQYKLSVHYSYGDRPFHRYFNVSAREHTYKLQRLKKASPLRVLMAISNIFTLLELYQSREDRAIDQSYLLSLQKLNCNSLRIEF